MTKIQYVIRKDQRTGETRYIVRRLESTDAGRSWIYCGHGKVFENEAEAEAEAYKKGREAH